MDPSNFIDPNLTDPDLLVLKNLLDDADGASQRGEKDSSSSGVRLRKCVSIKVRVGMMTDLNSFEWSCFG